MRCTTDQSWIHLPVPSARLDVLDDARNGHPLEIPLEDMGLCAS